MLKAPLNVTVMEHDNPAPKLVGQLFVSPNAWRDGPTSGLVMVMELMVSAVAPAFVSVAVFGPGGQV